MKAWQRNLKSQRMAPRVKRALARISRDRYLMPKEYNEICWRLSYCKSWNPHQTANYAACLFCEGWGMWKGAPPPAQSAEEFEELRDAIKKAEKKQEKGLERDASIELLIFKFTIRRLK